MELSTKNTEFSDFTDFLFRNRDNMINDIRVEFNQDYEPPSRPRRQYEKKGGYGRGGFNKRGGYNKGGYGRRDDREYRRDDRDYGYNKRGRGGYNRDRRGGGGYRQRRRGYSPSKNSRTLLGKGFPYDVDKDDVKEFFKPKFDRYVEYVYFINDRSGRFTGDCYIIFDDDEAAQDA